MKVQTSLHLQACSERQTDPQDGAYALRARITLLATSAGKCRMKQHSTEVFLAGLPSAFRVPLLKLSKGGLNHTQGHIFVHCRNSY